eukprot:CAMPEP_0174235338 /NCGR_PEP_ID=MMETSP0417-20130205/4814_1 /TAXON_ID=242541 /ORGANISM="Mayorella sp, Strain BSH-02190019" /LENGTH=879 /DNA_ID=CAMNT_0015313829 /DNA_START=69 /DNA_END=2708 /DNA_ORIENTATION=-
MSGYGYGGYNGYDPYAAYYQQAYPQYYPQQQQQQQQQQQPATASSSPLSASALASSGPAYPPPAVEYDPFFYGQSLTSASPSYPSPAYPSHATPYSPHQQHYGYGSGTVGYPPPSSGSPSPTSQQPTAADLVSSTSPYSSPAQSPVISPSQAPTAGGSRASTDLGAPRRKAMLGRAADPAKASRLRHAGGSSAFDIEAFQQAAAMRSGASSSLPSSQYPTGTSHTGSPIATSSAPSASSSRPPSASSSPSAAAKQPASTVTPTSPQSPSIAAGTAVAGAAVPRIVLQPSMATIPSHGQLISPRTQYGKATSKRTQPGLISRQSTFWQPVFHDENAIKLKDVVVSLSTSFEDPTFPADASSLFIDPRARQKDVERVQWKRPSEFSNNPALFVDGADEGDVVQGELGDCYFIGALAVIATRIDLLKEIIVSQVAQKGAYQFRFYKNGVWKVVTVDDRLPCYKWDKGGPMYGRCRDPNELWVPLIEKAYAKLHGSYEALDEGNIADAFVDLTGGTAETITLIGADSEKTWTLIQRSLEEGWLMGTAATTSGVVSSEAEIDGVGLYCGHAYAVIDAKIVNGRTRLIRLRNPWGKKEWKGKWSDKSSDWTPALRAELSHEDADDGAFWMEFGDYLRYFTKLTICRLYHDTIGQLWYRFLIQHEWKGKSAGGCTNHPTWIDNPQYGLTINQACEVYVSLMQEDIRMRGSGEYHCLGLFVFKVPDNKQRLACYDHTVELIGRPSKFINTREVTLELKFDEPGKYVLIPCTFQPNKEAKFTITIYSDKRIEPHKILGAGRVEMVAHRGVELLKHSTRTMLDLRLVLSKEEEVSPLSLPALSRTPTSFTFVSANDDEVVYSPKPAGPYTPPPLLAMESIVLPDFRKGI